MSDRWECRFSSKAVLQSESHLGQRDDAVSDPQTESEQAEGSTQGLLGNALLKTSAQEAARQAT